MSVQNVSASLNLSWGYDSCILKTFRVEGACVKPDCNSPCPENQDTKLSYVVNVVACDVEEVCKKLKNNGLIRTVKSIKVFNQPIQKINPLTDTSKSADCLTDVTPSLEECQDCCELLIDESVTETVGASMKATMTYRVVMAGTMNLNSSTSTKRGEVVMEGAMIIRGAFVTGCSRYVCSAGGTMTVASETNTSMTSRFYHLASGVMTLVDRTRLSYRSNNVITMSISSGTTTRLGFGHVVSGQMVVNSSFGVISSAYSHQMSGSMTISSTTATTCSNLGVISMEAGVVNEISNVAVLFSVEKTTAITAVVPIVFLPDCCSVALPAALTLKHNLQDVLALSNFLLRNGLTLPGKIDDNSSEILFLNYRPRLGVWQGNIHFDALSAVTSGRETWDFSFEYGCTNEAGGVELSVNVWMFSMMIRVRNYSTSKTYLTRLLSYFSIETVCPIERPFNGFDFDFNFKKLTSKPESATNSIFYDEAGFFVASPSFKNKQELKFRISAAELLRQQTSVVSLDDQAVAASHVADQSGYP